jgi:hypothetical protein
MRASEWISGRGIGRYGRRQLSGLTVAWVQQSEGIDIDPLRDPLQAFEGEIALAALDASHVCAVDAQHVGECLLAKTPGIPVGTQVTTDGSLQVALHAGKGRCLLL